MAARTEAEAWTLTRTLAATVATGELGRELAGRDGTVYGNVSAVLRGVDGSSGLFSGSLEGESSSADPTLIGLQEGAGTAVLAVVVVVGLLVLVGGGYFLCCGSKRQPDTVTPKGGTDTSGSGSHASKPGYEEGKGPRGSAEHHPELV